LSRSNPQTNTTSSAPARLCLLLCLASLACAAPPNALAQSPAPSPVVRPRTVGSKAEARPTPAPTPAAAPAQPSPAQTNAAPAQSNASPAPAAAAQTDETVDEDEVVRVDANIVIIPASVVDFRGRAITDLKVDDFELKIDGEVKPIGDLSRAETPVNVALLFDNSASLSAAREFEKQAAVRFFQSVVRPIDRAAVYSISTTPMLSQGLTNDVNRLVQTVQNFGKPDGATALFDALTQASDYMRPLAGRKVIVLVSDGTDTVSDASFEDALNRALLAECQVYVVQTRQVEDPNLHDTVSEQRMLKITEQTGGAVYVPRSIEELDAVFTQISLDLSQQYLLSYNPEDERRDRFFRFISVRVKTRQNLRVRARKGFYPSAAQAGAPQQPPPRGAQPSPLTSTQTRSGYVASQARIDAAVPPVNTQRRAPTATPSQTAARRDSSTSSRRPGPDGPDADDTQRPANAADESQPSFTLKTVAAVNAPSDTTAAGPMTVANAATESPASTPAPASNTQASGAGSNLFTPLAAASQPSDARASKAKDDAQPSTTKDDARPSTASVVEAAQPAPKEPANAAEQRKPPISGGVLNAKAVSLPKPEYPTPAKTAGAQGRVVVELTIDETGKVVKARALSGHPLLQKAAVAAALQARFSPTILSGEPVSVTGTISYTFVLQ
jgi:Ca-activated chloride channel homolog